MDADDVGTGMTGPRPDRTPEPDVAHAVDAVADRDLEPALLAALALGGAGLAWVAGTARGPWTAAGTVAVLAASAWLARRRDDRPPAFALRASRAGLSLAAAAVAVGVGHAVPAPLLAWFPAVCGVYCVVFGSGAAAAFTTATLGVLAVIAADPPSSGPSATAFAACAVAVLAVGLAGRTLRAVLAALPGSRPPLAAPHTPTFLAAAPSDVVVHAAPAEVRAPAVLPGHDELLAAVARAQSRGGVVGGDVALLVLTLQGADTLARSVGAGAATEVLETLARRARAWLPAGDVVAWLPGPRLAVLLEGVDRRTCDVVARRLAALLAEPVDAGAQVVSLPSTAALAVSEGTHEAPVALLARALNAGPLGSAPVEAPLGTPAASSVLLPPDALAADLGSALAAGAVTVALQPIVALGTLPRHDRVIAFEALARWTRGDGTSVPPARFVPAARRSGLAGPLGATVLAQGLDAVRARRAAGEPAVGLSVNVAPEQLGEPSVAAGVLEALARAEIEPSALAVEVPAAAAFEDPVVARSALASLRDAGVGVVLDNFGAVGLSITALRDLPLTGIKLDRSLTADLGVDDRLVVATVRLTTRLGLRCTAVGVETQTQLDAARLLGIDAVQGHLLGRPEQAPTRLEPAAGGVAAVRG